MAPPNSSSFSVNVVLPASGCEIIAKVRRLLISLSKLLSDKTFSPNIRTSELMHARPGVKLKKAGHFNPEWVLCQVK
jgi:hypothetical protein